MCITLNLLMLSSRENSIHKGWFWCRESDSFFNTHGENRGKISKPRTHWKPASHRTLSKDSRANARIQIPAPPLPSYGSWRKLCNVIALHCSSKSSYTDLFTRLILFITCPSKLVLHPSHPNLCLRRLTCVAYINGHPCLWLVVGLHQ